MKSHFFKAILLLSLGLLYFSCTDLNDNETIGKPDIENLIMKDSELFNLLERVSDTTSTSEITCIDFVYAFTIVEYNSELDIAANHVVSSDQQFSDLLGNIVDGNVIGISFPIESVLQSGETYSIQNKDELKDAIDACVDIQQDQIIGQCSNLLQECVWVVHHEDMTNDRYENAVFEVATDGTVRFYNNGIPYEGTWIVYFIENVLHTNIYLDDDAQTGADWNFDWETVLVDNETIRFSNNGNTYNLAKECDSLNYCKELKFWECEISPETGIATFTFENYIACILQINDLAILPDEDTIQFYESEEDANNQVNPLNQNSYTNTSAYEQIIYVRIDFGATNDFVIIPITIFVGVC